MEHRGNLCVFVKCIFLYVFVGPYESHLIFPKIPLFVFFLDSVICFLFFIFNQILWFPLIFCKVFFLPCGRNRKNLLSILKYWTILFIHPYSFIYLITIKNNRKKCNKYREYVLGKSSKYKRNWILWYTYTFVSMYLSISGGLRDHQKARKQKVLF